MESKGGDRDKTVLDRIARLEMVGIVGKTFGSFTVSIRYYSEHLTCVNLFLPITTLRGSYYYSHCVEEETDRGQGLNKFLKIPEWSIKYEMVDVARDETGKIGREEAKSVAQVEEFGLHFTMRRPRSCVHFRRISLAAYFGSGFEDQNTIGKETSQEAVGVVLARGDGVSSEECVCVCVIERRWN